jgi:hypothetical protein
MAVFAQYDYLFAVGTIFAFLDAWNIGANDVANSWASSVSSRSISYFQAMIGASIMEFTGALGVGGRVADTIRTKIVDVEAFDDSPALLMLGMVCAVVASASYLTFATRFGFPVSTTHSILGGVLGMGVGALGGSGITWVGYKEDGSLDIQQGVVQVSTQRHNLTLTSTNSHLTGFPRLDHRPYAFRYFRCLHLPLHKILRPPPQEPCHQGSHPGPLLLLGHRLTHCHASHLEGWLL